MVLLIKNIEMEDKNMTRLPQEAITRLAGKSAKLKEFKDDLKGNIIDINEDDMKVDQKCIKNNLKAHFQFQGNPIDWMTKAMTQEQAPRPSGKGPKVNSIRTSTMTSFMSQFCIYSYCFSGFGQAPPPDHVPGTSSKREVTLVVSLI